MNNSIVKLLSGGVGLARKKVTEAYRSRYFPEIWYTTEQWLLHEKRRKILVVGHSFGLFAEGLAKLGWDVTVVDPSLKALSELRRRFQKAGLSAAFEQAEPDAIPFANGSFPHFLSVNSIELAQNPLLACHELTRVLTPGGKGILTTFNSFGPWSLAMLAGLLQLGSKNRKVHGFTKLEFTQMLAAADWRVVEMKERARYLPFGLDGREIPVPGAFMALVEKSSSSRSGSKAQSTLKPRSRPSLSRKASPKNKP